MDFLHFQPTLVLVISNAKLRLMFLQELSKIIQQYLFMIQKKKMGIIAFLQVAGYITLLNDLKKSRMIQKLTFWSGMLLQASIYFRYLIPKIRIWC